MLDAAARLFGTQRFHEVRMEDIATEAAVGKGTLYRYFSDKEELYLALLGRASRQFQSRLQAQLARTDEPRARLEAIVEGIIQFFDEQPHLLDLIQRAELAQGPNFPWQPTRNEVSRLVHEIIEEGRASGAFTIRDPELAATMLLSGLRGIIRYYKPRPRHLAQHIVTGLLQGYADRP
jgi:AcrR family transcriptional regulator